MRNLFLFVKKNQFLVLFIVLQMISLSLLFNSYSYHKSLKFNTVSDFSGSVFSSYDGIVDYFSLKTENLLLLEENARLQSMLGLKRDTVYSHTYHSDSIYHFIPAEVVSNTVHKRNNFITINKGRFDGVEKEMGVISGKGIVGIVIGVSDHYALIMSMLHQNMTLSARIKKNNHLVNVVWKTRDYSTGTVIDIPSHIQLNEGDTIITSGNSLIFPQGIDIGTIRTHQKSINKGLGEATLIFSTEFNKLGHVYLIQNKDLKERTDLLYIENQADE